MRLLACLPAVCLLAGACSPREEQISREPHQRVAIRAEVAPPRATNPYEAMRWRMRRWVDENGRLAPDAWQQAHRRRAEIVAATQARGALATAGIQPGSWIERGPFNVGGRTRSLLIDPLAPDHMWAGAVSGGIWRTSDRGASWSPVNDEMTNLAICCLARDPGNPERLLAGTGEGFFNGDAVRGAGIYQSLDGGTTWAVLPATASWENINRIAVSSTGIILASVRYGGIRRSTDGANWTTTLAAQGSFFVAFDPADPDKAVAHVIDYDTDWFHRAVYSTDGGLTWSPAAGLDHQPGFGSRIELAYAPSDPSTVYASCALDGSVWRSTDGGQTYTRRSVAGFNSGSSWYANPLWVDPTNPDAVVTGGVHLFRSTDGGQTFAQISSGYIMTNQPHPDMHFVTHDPGYDGGLNRRAYVCTDGGVWCTDNIMAATAHSGWYRRDQGYRTVQYYAAAGHGPTNRIIGGTQDNGTLRLEAGGAQANLVFGGDGGFCAIDPDQPQYCYGEYIGLQIHRSTDGGMTASYIHAGIGDAGAGANFIAPFILDPNDPKRMLAGGRSLWRASDVRSPGNPVFTAIRPAGTDNISAIAVAPGNSDIIWVGQNDGVVARTANGTAPAPTWIDVDNNGSANVFPRRYIERILIDPENSNVVYVALGGFSLNNLRKTTDGGATWTSITGGVSGLPRAPINGLARHPLHPDWLYVGTEVGIFATTDGGATWSATNEGPADVSVDELTFMSDSRTLLAATHGRGIFTVDIPGVYFLDFAGDGDVDGDDYRRFLDCLSGPDAEPAPLAPCTPADCLIAFDADADGDVDFSDFVLFQAAFTGP